MQSATSYTSIAQGNVGMSVISAALLNILGVFVTVPIFILLGGSGEGAIGWETAERIALILLLPFAIGQLVQGWTKQLIARHQPKIIWIDRFVIALAVYVAFSGAVERMLPDGAEDAFCDGAPHGVTIVSELLAWVTGSSTGAIQPDRARPSAIAGRHLAILRIDMHCSSDRWRVHLGHVSLGSRTCS